jgi:hypothetical protein
VAVAFDEVFDAWNKTPGVTPAKAKTPTRLKAFGACARDPFWRENWRAALDRVARSSFCTGGGERGWRADLDWFLRTDKVTEVMEGKFDDRATKKGAGRGRPSMRYDPARDERRGRVEAPPGKYDNLPLYGETGPGAPEQADEQ